MAYLRRLPRRFAGTAKFSKLLAELAAKLSTRQMVTKTASRTTSMAYPAPDNSNYSSSSSSGRQIDPLNLKFNDPVASFKSKTMSELIRAYIVYQLCSMEFLVENNMKVYIIIIFNTIIDIRLI